VKTVVDEMKSQGKYTAFWDGTNDKNQIVASGIYLYRFQSDNFIAIKKCSFLK
jgi:flagellar hook assembly protein FlgD